MRRWSCSTQFVCRERPDGALHVVHIEHGDHVMLNRTARLFLQSVQLGNPFKTVLDEFEQRFSLSRAALRSDLLRLANELEELGILVRSPEEGHEPCT